METLPYSLPTQARKRQSIFWQLLDLHVQRLVVGLIQMALEDLLQEQLQAAWSDVATQWDAHTKSMTIEARQVILEFALNMAERLVHRVIEVDPSVVVDQVAGALALVLKPMDVSVSVHPSELPVISEALPHLMAEFDGRWAPAVAAYNAGTPQARLWLEQCGQECSDELFLLNISFRATRNYTADVLAGAWLYQVRDGEKASR